MDAAAFAAASAAADIEAHTACTLFSSVRRGTATRFVLYSTMFIGGGGDAHIHKELAIYLFIELYGKKRLPRRFQKKDGMLCIFNHKQTAQLSDVDMFGCHHHHHH